MNSEDFMRASLRTDLESYEKISEHLFYNEDFVRLLHAGIGMAGEAGEILDNLKKSMMYGKTLDHKNLVEECGDVLWYMAIMLNALDSSFEEAMRANVEKLAKRYPNGFTENDALTRADKAGK